MKRQIIKRNKEKTDWDEENAITFTSLKKYKDMIRWLNESGQSYFTRTIKK